MSLTNRNGRPPAGRRFADRRTLYTATIVGLVVAALALALWPHRGPLDPGDLERPLFVHVENAINGGKAQIDTDDENDDAEIIYAGIRPPRPDEPLFDEALRRNAELVNGKKARLRFGKQKHDDKSRMLVYVFVEDEFVNEVLVREGLAYVRTTEANYRFKDRLLAAQADARKHNRGLWSVRQTSREGSYPADPKYGNFHRPSCEECPKIRPERLVTFPTADRALSKGYAPCTQCKP